MRLIDADELIETLNSIKYLGIDSFSKIRNFEIDRCISFVETAPTADDWQKYSDELWKNAYAKGKEDVIHSIAKQYSEHNELVPIWLSIGDLKGGAE